MSNPSIRELYLEAKAASQKFSDVVNPKTKAVSDDVFELVQDAEIEAMAALKAALHARHGVTLEELQSL